jgi:hypothetical protein
MKNLVLNGFDRQKLGFKWLNYEKRGLKWI